MSSCKGKKREIENCVQSRRIEERYKTNKKFNKKTPDTKNEEEKIKKTLMYGTNVAYVTHH